MTRPTPSAAPFSPEKEYLRILYADDLAELREVARLLLSRDGHGVELVPDGRAAVERIAADPGFDLVITDHHMPVLNGLQLVQRLREMAFAGAIVVCSSELNHEVEQEYRRLNVDRFLYKPVPPAILRQTLAEIFPGIARRTADESRIDRPFRRP